MSLAPNYDPEHSCKVKKDDTLQNKHFQATQVASTLNSLPKETSSFPKRYLQICMITLFREMQRIDKRYLQICMIILFKEMQRIDKSVFYNL